VNKHYSYYFLKKRRKVIVKNGETEREIKQARFFNFKQRKKKLHECIELKIKKNSNGILQLIHIYGQN